MCNFLINCSYNITENDLLFEQKKNLKWIGKKLG